MAMTTYKELLGFKEENDETKKKLEALLKKSWEIRDFEIELFWKRATYFSVIVGALLVAFYNTQDCKNCNNLANIDYKLIISFLGCVSSFVWWLSNRGSKFWQENWEKHIDLLENEINNGDIYRLVLGKRNNAFSVSKLNIYFSFVVFIAWITLYYSLIFSISLFSAITIIQVFKILIIPTILLTIYFRCKTSFKDEKSFIKDSDIEYLKRKI